MKIGRVAAAATACVAAGAAHAVLDDAQGLALMQKSGCAACHAIDRRIVGPAYVAVAARYRGDPAAAARLVKKVKEGGGGVWGEVPMPPNAAVAPADVVALVTWLLTLQRPADGKAAPRL